MIRDYIGILAYPACGSNNAFAVCQDVETVFSRQNAISPRCADHVAAAASFGPSTAKLALPIRSAVRLLRLTQEIWVGEAKGAEARCRRLTLRRRCEAAVDVGSTPFNDLNANRIVWIIGLRV